MSVEMYCTHCMVVYDVFYEGEHIWRVTSPNPRLVEGFDGKVRPLDFEDVDQIQAAVKPMCIQVLCVVSPTRGYLSDEPIPVKFDA